MTELPSNLVGSVWEPKDIRDGSIKTVITDDGPGGFVTVKGFIKTRLRRENLPRRYRMVKGPTETSNR